MRSLERSKPDEDRFSIWNLVRHYRFNSVFVRNLLIIVLIFLVPIGAIGLFFYDFSTNVIEDEMRLRNATDARRYRDITDAYLLQLQHLVLNLATDADVNAFLFENEINVPNSLELFDIVQDMEKMQRLVTAIGYIDSIYIYSLNNGYVLSLEGARPVRPSDDGDWLSLFEEHRERRGVWFARRTATDGGPTLSVFWNVYLYDRLDGVIIVNIDPAEFRAVLESRRGHGAHLYLTDADGALLYTGGRSPPANIRLPTSIPDGPRTEILRAENEQSVVSTLGSERFDYAVHTILSLGESYESLREMRKVLGWILILGTLGSLALSFFVSVKVFEPVRNIIQYIDGLDVYPDGSAVDLRRSAEVKYIAESIGRIVTSDKEREGQLRTRIALLKKAHASALQSQINPHFLYNTLDAIRWTTMRLTRGKNAASDMVGSLSKLLRYGLEADDSMATIGEELEHASLYLDILQWRYKDAFEVRVDVEEDIRDRRTVRLCLQPILENAVYHGIKPKKNRCHIDIDGGLHGTDVVLRIRDDGVGLPELEVAELNDSLDEDFLVEHRHIGLRNVNQRIRLVFGESYGVRVGRNEPTGLVVTLTVPAVG